MFVIKQLVVERLSIRLCNRNKGVVVGKPFLGDLRRQAVDAGWLAS